MKRYITIALIAGATAAHAQSAGDLEADIFMLQQEVASARSAAEDAADAVRSSQANYEGTTTEDLRRSVENYKEDLRRQYLQGYHQQAIDGWAWVVDYEIGTA